MTRLAPIAHLGPRGRHLAAMLREYGRMATALSLGITEADIDAVVRVAGAMEPEPAGRRDYVAVRALTPGESAGLGVLVAGLVDAVGVRALARTLACGHGTVLLYARGRMRRTAPMLAPLARVLGQPSVVVLLSVAEAAGVVMARPVARPKVLPPRRGGPHQRRGGLDVIDVRPRGAHGALVLACVRAGATASEIAAELGVTREDVFAVVDGRGLPGAIVERLGGMLARLLEERATDARVRGVG